MMRTGRPPTRPRSQRAHPRRARAFSLVDTIVAIVVLAMVVPGTVVAISDASVQRASGIAFSRARWLATEKLEDVIADRASTTRGYAYIMPANYAAESAISGFPGFTRSVAVTETGASLSGGGTGYKTVVVSVAWVDPRRGARTLALSTVLTDYTP